MVIVVYSELFGRENIPKVRKFHLRQVYTYFSGDTRDYPVQREMYVCLQKWIDTIDPPLLFTTVRWPRRVWSRQIFRIWACHVPIAVRDVNKFLFLIILA